MAENKNSSSFFLYTALIFLVAMIMIIISFFGQGNHQSAKESAKTLTEKASAVSEENLVLSKKVTELEGDVSDRDEIIKTNEETIAAKDETIKKVSAEADAYKNIIIASERVKEKKYNEAATAIALIDPTILSDDTLNLYNQIAEIVKEKGE